MLKHNSLLAHYPKTLKKILSVGLFLNFSLLFASKDPLLTKISLESKSNGIIVIGATNRKKLLDDALLRSGRFDQHINFIDNTYEGLKNPIKFATKMLGGR